MSTKTLYALSFGFFMATTPAIAHDNNPSFKKVEELELILPYDDPNDHKPRGLFKTAKQETIILDCESLDALHIRAIMLSKEKKLWHDEQDRIHRIEHNTAEAKKKMACPANSM